MTIEPFYLTGTPEEILTKLGLLHPELPQVLNLAREAIGALKPKREIYEYQAACLYHFACWYNHPGAKILEIGTALGYSAAVLAMGARQALLTTLNPKESEVPVAVHNLSRWPNVKVVQQASQDFLITAGLYDLIFVDGDHARVQSDLGYLLHLNPAGLIVFHDYSPQDSARPCPPVYNALNRLCGHVLNRPLDILVIDDQLVGLAGLFQK